MKKNEKVKVGRNVLTLLKKIDKVTGSWQTGENCAKANEIIKSVLSKVKG